MDSVEIEVDFDVDVKEVELWGARMTIKIG